MNTVLIFAGAGASKAVSPQKYPTTVEFLENLDKKIRDHAMFRQVEEFLLESDKDKILDIELILWRLQELRNFCELGTDRTQFPGWVVSTGRLTAALQRQNENIGNFSGLSTLTIQTLDGLISQINRTVYDLYSQLPSEDELSSNWTPLLKGCQDIGFKTEIVTTNYDLVIEAALDLNPAADTGWRGSVVRTLDVNSWNTPSQSQGLLTKLHGSVNWSKRDDRIFVGDPFFKGSHQNHVIIYPGFKGKPADACFLSFHEHFRRCVRSAKAIVFVGFAFRDQYINDICSTAISSGTKVLSINRSQVTLPFDAGDHHHITGSFATQAVEECLTLLRSASVA